MLKQELSALRDELNSSRDNQKKAQADQYDQAKRQIRTEAKLFVDANDQYEAIRAHGDVAIDAAVRLIEKTFEKKGYLMPVEQAVQAVEGKLLERALSLSKLKKVQEKLAPAPAPAEAGNKAPIQEQKPPTTTLSSRLTPRTGNSKTEQDRINRAIAAFNGKLN